MLHQHTLECQQCIRLVNGSCWGAKIRTARLVVNHMRSRSGYDNGGRHRGVDVRLAMEEGGQSAHPIHRLLSKRRADREE